MKHVINTPVDLLVINQMHCDASDVIDAEERARRTGSTGPVVDWDALPEILARRLLQQVCSGASLSKVLAALAAAGGPATREEILQRFNAVADARRTEAGSAPAASTLKPASKGETA